MKDVIDITNKFNRVEQEIQTLRQKCLMEEGWLFFKNWKWSIDELLESEHFDKIFSITEKIGDDVKNWIAAGTLSNEGLAAYNEAQETIRRKLKKVRKEIKERKPKFFEKISAAVKNAITFVERVMPLISPIVLIGKGLRQLTERPKVKQLPKPKEKNEE